MNIDTFLAHHHVKENPFAAEEARLDPVFGRLIDGSPTHPDFPKVLGQIDKPATSIVFGEKGSGKTAIRLQLARQVAEHNREHPDRRVLTVAYDDLNPMLDNLLRRHKQKADAVLAGFRLEDHQDAILSLAVTRLVDALLHESPDGEDPIALPEHVDKHIKKNVPRQVRVDLAVLAALYDQPRNGSAADRLERLWKKLRLGYQVPQAATFYGAILLSLITVGLGLTMAFVAADSRPWWLIPSLGLAGAAALLLWGLWGYRHAARWRLAHKAARDMPAVNRTAGELAGMLGRFGRSDLLRQPLPSPETSRTGESDSRYQLTRRWIDVLHAFGYTGLIVLVDRLDEPTLVSGDADRMKAILWPMMDNKFLKQDRIGIKLLLPIELRHMLHRESARFFQEARLDKQNLIDRLSWSGAMLYDLCSRRLRACMDGEPNEVTLTSLFENDVSRDLLIDALDQMHQPRDAFKFLYNVIQEHCRIVPEEQPRFQIARLTLESVRRDQAQRVQELYRGLSPA